MKLSILAMALLPMLTSPATAESRRHYQTGTYDRIYLQGNAQLRLTQVDQPQADAHAEGTALQLDHLSIENSDGVLYIDAPKVGGRRGPVVYVGVHQLKEVVSEGAGEVYGDGLTSPTLALEGRGNGSFKFAHLNVGDLVVVGEGQTRFQVSGATNHQFIDLAGAGSYAGARLSSQTSQVMVRGAGRIDLWVEDLLDVDVMGAALVRYNGSPWVLQQISGAGSVNRLP